MQQSYPKLTYMLCMFLFVAFVIGLCMVGYCAHIILPFRKNIDLCIEGDRPWMDDEVIGFTAASRASSFCKHPKTGLAYHLFTDERCARVNSISESTPPKVTLMTIGCSFSWGVGIENDQTFTEILKHRLEIPVANFAMGSYGTVQSIQMLENNIDLKPDIIIYGFQADHMRRNLRPCAPSYNPFCLSIPHVDFDLNMQPYIHPPNMEYSLQMQLKFWEEAVFDDFGFNDIVWGAKIAYHRLASKRKETHADNSQLRKKSLVFLIKKMGTIAKSINAALIIVHIPYLERGQTNDVARELIDALDKEVVFIDLSPAIRNYYSNPANPDLRFQYDGHPNRFAHRLMADELEKVLRDKYIINRQ